MSDGGRTCDAPTNLAFQGFETIIAPAECGHVGGQQIVIKPEAFLMRTALDVSVDSHRTRPSHGACAWAG